MRKPNILKPALHLTANANVLRDGLLFARRGTKTLYWRPANGEGTPAQLILAVEGDAHCEVLQTGGRPGKAIRENIQTIATFFGVPVEDAVKYIGIGRTVVWNALG